MNNELLLTHCCNKMKYYLELKDPIIVKYIPKFDEYGIIVNDGGHSFIIIKYCPWCGKELPKRKRDLWFKKLVRWIRW